MTEIKEFHCTYKHAVGIHADVVSQQKLTFPDAYLHWKSMAEIALACRQYEGAPFCVLPFCHTVEAEAMGGMVNYGNEIAGPRAKEYICTQVEELLALPDIDFGSGRIREVLHACRYLREQGEHVVLQVAGPFTIMNVLIDPKYVYKAMRRQPELMKQVFERLQRNLLQYIVEAQKYDVDMISYADASGGVTILGPKMAAQVVKDFTHGFLKKAWEQIGDGTILLLCPKTTFALLGTERAKLKNVKLEMPMRYGEACAALIGKEKIVGQMCIKNSSHTLSDQTIQAVTLL